MRNTITIKRPTTKVPNCWFCENKLIPWKFWNHEILNDVGQIDWFTVCPDCFRMNVYGEKI